MKINKNIFFFSLFLILLLAMCTVSAETMDDSNITVGLQYGDDLNVCHSVENEVNSDALNNDQQIDNLLVYDGSGASDASSDDLSNNGFNALSIDIDGDKNINNDKGYDKSTNFVDSGLKCYDASVLSIFYDDALSDFNPGPMAYIVTPENIGYYFNDGVLDSSYNNSTLVFQGAFNNLGILRIANNGTAISGFNALFNNTVFSIEGKSNTLTNVSMYLDKSFSKNDYAGILVHGSNNTISNVFINYTGPKNEDAYPILADGTDYVVDNLTLFNNTIYYSGNSKNNGHNYAVRLIYANNANVTHNKVYCQMPLRTIVREIGIFLEKEFSAAIGIKDCDSLSFADNEIYVNITGREGHFPTVDGILIVGSSNSLIKKQIINYFYLKKLIEVLK